MKKITILALTFILTAGLLAACRGNVNSDSTDTSTNASTQPTTAATTPSTTATVPSTAATTPSNANSGMLEDGMIDGNGDAGSSGSRTNQMH